MSDSFGYSSHRSYCFCDQLSFARNITEPFDFRRERDDDRSDAGVYDGTENVFSIVENMRCGNTRTRFTIDMCTSTNTVNKKVACVNFYTTFIQLYAQYSHNDRPPTVQAWRYTTHRLIWQTNPCENAKRNS